MPPRLLQVDEIFRAAALAANEARLPLAKMAVEETGMGLLEDKVGRALRLDLTLKHSLVFRWEGSRAGLAASPAAARPRGGSAGQPPPGGARPPQVTKNHFASEFVYHKYRDEKTVDVIECDSSGALARA